MMNERIYELAKQADLIQWDVLPSGARTPEHESVAKAMKFAELIVRECADLFEIEWGEEKLTGNDVGYVVKKHFGVTS